MVPGWTGSGPEHWQTLWETALANARRVTQRDWDHPDRDEWVAALDRDVRTAAAPPLLIAHSLGCLVVVHWAATHPAAHVRGALLVAPPDVERVDADPALRGFAPTPTSQLPFPTVVVASRNDPFADPATSRALARHWGADFVDAGAVGHINTASGLGRWDAGLRILSAFGVHDSR